MLNKRADGYHNIETALYPVQWYDCLEAKKSESLKFEIIGRDTGASNEENLVIKAYRLLESKYKIPPVHFCLLKNLPTGAGLGGGSSDASHTILMLRDYFKLPITSEEINLLALQLGSDCPFFITCEPMLASGRGEILSPLALNLEEYFVAIAFPSVEVSTAWAYSKVNPKNNRQPISEILQLPLHKWKEKLVNDFEEVVFKAYPAIAKLKETFYQSGALYSAMSGSGSAVYSIFEQIPERLDLHKTCSISNLDLFIGKLNPQF